MEISEIQSQSEQQDRGRWFDLPDPVTDAKTGIRLLIAGPDSETQRRNRLLMADELADLADADGRVTADARESCRINNLARCVRDWEITEAGEALPFSHAGMVRLLKAGVWVQAFVDYQADNRAAFRGAT